MSLLVTVLTAFIRLVRPASGLHKAPRAVAETFTEPTAPRVSAPLRAPSGRHRVRPYAAAVGAAETPDAHGGYPMPADASPVRLYVVAHEARSFAMGGAR